MKTVSFQIPTKNDFIRWREIIRFKINGGFKCTKCNSKMFFDHVHISQPNFLFENFTNGLCTRCTVHDINFNEHKIFTSEHKCDWCDSDKNLTANWIKNADMDSDIIFGMNWWNGFYICPDCLSDHLISNIGNETSSIFKTNKNGKIRPVNSLGICKP